MVSPVGKIAEPARIHIGEFEGLRGILAAWVIFGHILLFSGFTYQDGWFGILFSPVLGVYSFMMLSGFVITAAIDQRPTSWTGFMTRRFFRLFPVYALCVGLAILMMGVSLHISQSPTLSTFGPENMERLENVQQNFGLYLLADATLLQCLLPRTWYPAAQESFLVPTWSLTIEWLFYMVAPFIVLLIRRSKSLAIGTVFAGLVAIWIFEPFLTSINHSFHLGNAFHFLTGIGSFYLWKHLPDCRRGWFGKIVFWSLVLAGGACLNLPYKIWIATMAIILYSRVHLKSQFFLEWPRKILLSRPLQFMGRTSYAAYLLHWIIIEIVLFWIIQFAPGFDNKYLLTTSCVLAVYPMTYVASAIIHRHVERPLIQFPAWWGQGSIRNRMMLARNENAI